MSADEIVDVYWLHTSGRVCMRSHSANAGVLPPSGTGWAPIPAEVGREHLEAARQQRRDEVDRRRADARALRQSAYDDLVAAGFPESTARLLSGASAA